MLHYKIWQLRPKDSCGGGAMPNKKPCHCEEQRVSVPGRRSNPFTIHTDEVASAFLFTIHRQSLAMTFLIIWFIYNIYSHPL